MFILSFSVDYYLAIVSCIVLTFGEMLFYSAAKLTCYENSSKHKKGSGLGVYQSVLAGSFIFGPIFGGYIYHRYGGTYVWLMCGVAAIVCLIISFFLSIYNKSVISFNSNTTP